MAPARLSSCGRPVSIAQVRVVDGADGDVRVGEAGEIITRGRHMMRGYWRREEETATTMRGGGSTREMSMDTKAMRTAFWKDRDRQVS
jgi:long-subunit acyl-CoA synthetase (AMP-forming)